MFAKASSVYAATIDELDTVNIAEDVTQVLFTHICWVFIRIIFQTTNRFWRFYLFVVCVYGLRN